MKSHRRTVLKRRKSRQESRYAQSSHRLGMEQLERRELLAADLGWPVADPYALDGPSGSGTDAIVRVIVELDHKAFSGSVIQAAESKSATGIRELSELPFVIMEVTESQIPELSQWDGVKHVQRDIPVPPSLASTIPLINADDVHAMGFTGAGVPRQSVVIIDTGIDTTHPFFAAGARILQQRCFSTPGPTSPADPVVDEFSLCPNGQTTDTSADVNIPLCNVPQLGNICDHGTHVAGIAAGNNATDPSNSQDQGVAPGANIIAMQVFTRFDDPVNCDPQGRGMPTPCVLSYPSDQLAALNAVIAMAPTINIAAVNMSLGGGQNSVACDTDPLKTAIDTLLQNEIATVISAGNDGFGNAVGSPGCISSAFTVGSTTDVDGISSFSNRGPLLDVFAPGSSVTSSVPGGYATFNGTSMAAPHVAGALALLKQANPNRSIIDLMADLQSSGVPISYASGGSTVTTRRIDVLAALEDRDDQISEAIPLTVGAVVEGELSLSLVTDVNLYEFTAAPGQQIGFDTDTFDSRLDARIRLFDASGQELANNDDGVGPAPEDDSLESYLEYTFPSQGTYYLGISYFENTGYGILTGGGDTPTSAVSAVGRYTLEARSLGVEGNGTLATATTVSLENNPNFTGRIDPSVEVDMVRFFANAQQEVQIIADVTSGNLRSHIRVFDAAGNELAARSGNPDATVGFLVPSNGIYFVGVSSDANRDYDPVAGSAATGGALDQTGDYFLRLRADSSVVTTTSDVVAADGLTSLREAVNVANSILGTNFISFDPSLFSTPQTIQLVGGELSLSDDVFITGPGADLLTISAAANSRIFNIDDGLSGNQLVILEAMRLTGGNTVSGGGAIRNNEETRLRNMAIEGNRAATGGGVSNSGVLAVVGSTIADNTGVQRGGAIHQSTPTATTTISQSTVSGNTSVTGGGIDTYRGDVTLLYSTVANNSGGGIFSFGNYALAETRIRSSIISGNSGGDVVRHDLFQTTIFSDGHNLVGSGTAAFRFNQPGDLRNVDPRLGPLASNGGPTRTHALLAGSPARDAGDPNILSAITTDQRGPGFPRIIGSQVDMGAFETEAGPNFVVDSISDIDDGNVSPGNLTLREAIRLANTLSGPDTITFDPALVSSPRTILLTGQLPTITSSLSIEGPGADRLTLDGQGSHLITYINDFNNGAAQTVSISGLTMTRGNGFYGGAINSRENLTLTGVTLSNSRASANGGAISSGGVLTIVDSTITGNAGRDGGGISAGALYVTDSTFSDNTASRDGGAISTSGNTTIDGTTLTGNTAANRGGALFIRDGVTVISNSTISGNDAETGGGLRLYGGFGNLTVRHSTITDNTATITGGGLSKGSSGSTFLVENSIVSGNRLNGVANNLDGSGFSGGFNLLGDGFTSFGVSNIVTNDPRLAPLAMNGGPTLTHQPLEASLAINAGNASTVSGSIDQTGGPRVVGGIVDIGAVEANPPVVRDLGPLAEGASSVPAYELRNSEVAFYRFELAEDVVASNAGNRLVIDTLGSTLSVANDTEIALYDAAGNLVAENDDIPPAGLSQLSFGDSGTDGLLLSAGTYYLAISAFNTEFGATDFQASSSSTNSGNVVVNFNLTTGTAIDGDFNDDGLYDCQDIDALSVNISGGTGNLAFDLDENGVLDGDDLAAWLAEAGAVNNASGGAYLSGDANLDGVVDISDFNVWNANKFGTGAWCSGDFNVDGVVDTSDFNLWNANKFNASDAPNAVPVFDVSNTHATHESERERSSSRLADLVFQQW